MDALTGSTAKKQYNLAKEAQERQIARQADEDAKLDRVEAGQKLVRTGGRGMLAFVDDASLKQTFGQAI